MTKRAFFGLLLLVLAGDSPAGDVPGAVSFEEFLAEVRSDCAARDADGVCEAHRDAPSLLVVGLDGVNWDVLDPLLEGGFLPTLRGLVEAGTRAKLDCIPAASLNACFDPPVWGSLATGQPTGVHQVRSLDTPSTQRRAPALWSVLHRHGGAAGIANFRNAWPPEPDLEWVLTEEGIAWAAGQIFTPWPANRGARRGSAGNRTRPPGLFERVRMLPHAGPRPPSWRSVATDRVTMEAVLRLEVERRYRDPVDRRSGDPIDRRDRDSDRGRRPYLVWVHLNSTDLAGHYMWHTIQKSAQDPVDADALRAQAATWKGPRHREGPHGYDAIPHRLLEVEQWLSVLLRHVDYDYVVVHSDHGMGRARRESGLPGNHVVRAVPEARYGIFVVSGAGVVAGQKLNPISLLDVAPTLAWLLGLPVAADLPGRVLLEAFHDDFKASHPLEKIPSW